MKKTVYERIPLTQQEWETIDEAYDDYVTTDAYLSDARSEEKEYALYYDVTKRPGMLRLLNALRGNANECGAGI